MERSKRIFFLLVINLILVFLSLYILDFFQIIDYKQLLKKVPVFQTAFKTKVEDPFLWEKMELEKKWQILDEQIITYSNEMIALEESKLEIEEEWEALAKEQENVEAMIENFEAEQEAAAAYDERVTEIAEQLMALPPVDAVKIIEQQDDLMIADIFREMEVLAEDMGQGSPVPGIMMQMDPEQTARVQRKMLQE